MRRIHKEIIFYIVFSDYRLTFKEVPKLQEIQIDPKSSLKWCPKFMSDEESNGLFKHILQELNFVHTEISMYGKPVNLVRK